jgi:hypothetical protein
MLRIETHEIEFPMEELQEYMKSYPYEHSGVTDPYEHSGVTDSYTHITKLANMHVA